MNVRGGCVDAVHGEVTLDRTGCQVDRKIGSAGAAGVNRRDFLVPGRCDSELQDVPDGHRDLCRLADVSGGVLGFGSQHVVAFRCCRRIPVDAVWRVRIAGEQGAVEEEAHLGDAHVVAGGRGQRYDAIDGRSGGCLERRNRR